MPSAAETKFANELEASGFTFERNCNDLPGTPDIVFREINLAVFFHGCFWHSHHCQKNTSSYEWSENLKKYLITIKVSCKSSTNADFIRL